MLDITMVAIMHVENRTGCFKATYPFTKVINPVDIYVISYHICMEQPPMGYCNYPLESGI
jgi:hypothetical protein